MSSRSLKTIYYFLRICINNTLTQISIDVKAAWMRVWKSFCSLLFGLLNSGSIFTDCCNTVWRVQCYSYEVPLQTVNNTTILSDSQVSTTLSHVHELCWIASGEIRAHLCKSTSMGRGSLLNQVTGLYVSCRYAVQGHSRSLMLVPIEKPYATSHRPINEQTATEAYYEMWIIDKLWRWSAITPANEIQHTELTVD